MIAALLDDDINDDTECAMLIFHQKGFQYWPQWNTRCKNDNHITNEIYRFIFFYIKKSINFFTLKIGDVA